MTEAVLPLDRRQRRRRESIEEILDVAVEVMAEQGVAGLSIGEVARRMGIRPPSLYVYFDSKHALYDGLFARGAKLVLAAVEDANEAVVESAMLEEALLVAGTAIVRWSVENPAYSQLLFWRPVPGFTPSAEAYAPAVRLVELARERFRDFQTRGLLRADVPVEEIQRDWTVLTAGVISQQLSNAPQEKFEKGMFTTALPGLVAMFAAHYSPPSPSTTRPRRGRRADTR
jgi:AcrR family transcriptional regulator